MPASSTVSSYLTQRATSRHSRAPSAYSTSSSSSVNTGGGAAAVSSSPASVSVSASSSELEPGLSLGPPMPRPALDCAAQLSDLQHAYTALAFTVRWDNSRWMDCEL